MKRTSFLECALEKNAQGQPVARVRVYDEVVLGGETYVAPLAVPGAAIGLDEAWAFVADLSGLLRELEGLDGGN